MKKCKRCGQDKPLSHYSRHSTTKDRLQTWCRECRAEWLHEHRRLHPEKWTQYSVRYREKNFEAIRQRRRDAYRSDPESARKWLAARLKRDFGLSIEEYDVLVDGPCSICGDRPPSGDNRVGVVLDHDHVSGTVRGALCQLCNTGLGKFGDDPARLRAAADYLEKHARSFCVPPRFD